MSRKWAGWSRLARENYLGRTGEPDLGGTDGNHTEAGCLTLLAQRWRTAVLGGKRKLELLPNTNVNVRINSRERLNVLAVPRGSVETIGGQSFVLW